MRLPAVLACLPRVAIGASLAATDPTRPPIGDAVRLLTNADLDVCHGHTGVVTIAGRRVRSYHDHAALEYPYTLGCFHGTPVTR